MKIREGKEKKEVKRREGKEKKEVKRKEEKKEVKRREEKEKKEVKIRGTEGNLSLFPCSYVFFFLYISSSSSFPTHLHQCSFHRCQSPV